MGGMMAVASRSRIDFYCAFFYFSRGRQMGIIG